MLFQETDILKVFQIHLLFNEIVECDAKLRENLVTVPFNEKIAFIFIAYYTFMKTPVALCGDHKDEIRKFFTYRCNCNLINNFVFWYLKKMGKCHEFYFSARFLNNCGHQNGQRILCNYHLRPVVYFQIIFGTVVAGFQLKK